MNIIEVNVNEIKVGNRFRKDMGDMAALAKSVDEIGDLLQPIGITPDMELVFGERRLRAYRDVLGRETIPARIIPVKSMLHGQIAENTMQKAFAPSEMVAIVDALRTFRHGGDRRSKQAHRSDVNKLTLDKAAKLGGLGGKDTYNRAKAVVEKGIPELIQAMDSDKLSIAAASEIAQLRPVDQLESVRRGKKVIARDPHDFYPTPRGLTEAVLQAEHFGKQVWEPACGDGAMAEVLKAAGYEVIASDLIDRGYGEVEDFLTSDRKVESIVTNPPFKIAEEFLQKALKSTTRNVAMLLPLTFLEGQERAHLLRSTPLKAVHVFSYRVSFCRNRLERPRHGRAAIAWFVWEHGYSGQPTVSWLGESQRETAPRAVTGGWHQKPLVPAAATIQLPPPDINSVLQGDCRDLIPLLPDASINLCLCSPPYADQRKGEYPGVPEKDYPTFTVEWMGKLRDKLTNDGSVLIVIDPHVEKGVMADYVLRTQLALREAGWKEHQTLIWHKPDRGPLGHRGWPRHTYEQVLWFSKTNKPFCDPIACGKPCRKLSANKIRHSRWSPGGKPEKLGTARVSDVINVPVGKNEKGIDHPAMFPVELAERLIATFCPKNGKVLDPFAGSGTTLAAANRLGKNFYGFDMVARFCKIARRRLAKIPEGKVSLPRAG